MKDIWIEGTPEEVIRALDEFIEPYGEFFIRPNGTAVFLVEKYKTKEGKDGERE